MARKYKNETTMIKNVRYKDKHDNIVEAVINIQKGKVIATTGVYEREYTQEEWQERIEFDGLCELEEYSYKTIDSIDIIARKTLQWLESKRNGSNNNNKSRIEIFSFLLVTLLSIFLSDPVY
jgi:hypothetical protein